METGATNGVGDGVTAAANGPSAGVTTAPRAVRAGRAVRAFPPVGRRDVAVLSGTVGLWALVTWAAALSVRLSPFPAPTWARWDSGNYVTIADHGYSFRPCVDVPNRSPDDWCGTVAWFPGYSYATRVVGWFGLEVYPAGRIVAWAAFLAAVFILWFGFLRPMPTKTGVAGMALAVVFPGSIYYAALFPISGVVAAALLMLVFIDRRHWALAGMCAAFAAVYYNSGWLLGAAAIVPLTASALGDIRTRIRAAAWIAAPPVLGYVLVMANIKRAVGRWDAHFLMQQSYDVGPTLPTTTFVRRVEYISGAAPNVIGVQTIVVAVIVLAGWAMAWVNRSSLSLAERAIAVLLLPYWIGPLALGGDLSVHRAESLLVPVVILLARGGHKVLVPLVVVCVPIAFLMARLYFQDVLI